MSKQDERANDNRGKKLLSNIKKELFGIISADTMPSDLQEQITLFDLNISQNEWDKYSCAKKGKIVAASIIKNRIELIRRIYEYLETNKRNALKK